MEHFVCNVYAIQIIYNAFFINLIEYWINDEMDDGVLECVMWQFWICANVITASYRIDRRACVYVCVRARLEYEMGLIIE